jgi:hypothetical protein
LEHEFCIPFTTAAGKTVLRGKIDGVFTNPTKIWVFESKFKSRIDEGDLVDTLPFDFQVLFYLTAVRLLNGTIPKGFLYNIVRRIGLNQKEDETITQFAKRCVDDIRKRPEFYFIRREVSIGKDELDAFQEEMGGLVEEFILWHQGKLKHYKNTGSCIDKYGRCNYLNLCAGYGFGHYIKRDKMFMELEA